MILTFLQNAWFHRPLHKGWEEVDGKLVPVIIPEWSEDWRTLWLWATARSRSGARLKVMLGDDCFDRSECAFADASPKVSYGSSAGRFDGDPEWCKAEIANYLPDVVVCCGNEAIDTVTPIWGGPLICVPHPTSRVVTNALYADAGALALRRGYRRRVRFTQVRGGHHYDELPAIAAPQ